MTSILKFIGLSINSSKYITTISVATTKLIHTTSSNNAARKGTRAKAAKKKVKIEVKKVGFIPHNQRGRQKRKVSDVNKYPDDSHKPVSFDDVWPMRYYQTPTYSAAEAIECHKETHHPTMYNALNSYISARIELNMVASKETRFLESFSRIALVPHGFPKEEQRTMLVFTKDQSMLKEAMEAGATMAGGTEIIRSIKDGEIKLGDYDYLIAHPDILTELVPLRGLMKRRFPNPKSGTLHPDVVGLVKKFSSGIQYRAVRDEHVKSFASIDSVFGRLNMDTTQLVDNFKGLISDIDSIRPKRSGLFITRCFFISEPSKEILKVNPFEFIKSEIKRSQAADDSDDEEEEQQSAQA